MTTITTDDRADTRYMRSLRIEATYGAVPWACPETVAVEWTEPDAMPTATDINVAIAQLAAVPALARIDGEAPDAAGMPMRLTTPSGGYR